MKNLAALGVLLALCMGAGLALHEPGALSLGEAVKPWFVALLALAAVLWAVAVRTVLRAHVCAKGLAAGLALALALRAVLVLQPAFLSSDVNRYVWDGRVQAAGINPYLYVPADPALTALRDPVVFPNINRAATAPTIYAPAAQMVFAAAAWLAPGITGMKAVMVGFEALAVLALILLLRAAGRPASHVLIYAWNPLPLWAFAGNGHVDAMAIGLICAAMWLAALRRPALAGAVFAAAVLTKFLPAVLAPALWRRGGWRLPAAAGGTILALYACYAGAGGGVLGFLPGYAPDEGLTAGTGFWLLAGIARLGALPAGAAMAYAAAIVLGLAAVALHVLRQTRPDDGAAAIGRDAALLAAALTVGISPHYPWYFAWLAALAVLHPTRPLLWLAASPVLLYVNPFGDQFLWPCLVYVPAALLALADLRPALKAPPLPSTSGHTT